MDLLLLIVGGYLGGCAIFALGYLCAAREFGKDVRFYKDSIRTLRAELYKREGSREEVEDDTKEIPEGSRIY